MPNAVVNKQGQPSKPGAVVGTSKAKVVPASSEVKTEAAAREVAGQKKATQKGIDGLAKKMTHPARAKDEAVKAVTGKSSNGSGPVTRLTETWASKSGKGVKVKDQVKLPSGAVIDVIGRWTKRKGDAVVPMVTGCIVSGAPDGKKKNDRQNAAVAEVTHVK